MKVALNATCFNERPSGAKQRFLGIYRNLVRRLPQVEFVVFEPSDCRMDRWFGDAPNVQTRATPIRSEGRFGKLLDATRFWSRAFRHERFDLFESFHLPLPKAPTGKTVLTLHDIRRLRADWNGPGRIAFRYALGRALRYADLVVTVSDAMKREMQPHCSHTPIYVIPNGLEATDGCPPSDAALLAFRRKLGLPATFLLAVGHFERRKNYPKLIDALAHLHATGRHCHLLIVGNDSGGRPALESHIVSHKLSGYVTLSSGLSDIEVRCAYALCSLFVFPSTYEGFGIPILEAMGAARPMALSDIPVFREITENRGAYFSPDDAQDMARTIERILASPGEQVRLIDYGRERVQAYDYAAIGAQYQRLYSRLLGTG